MLIEAQHLRLRAVFQQPGNEDVSHFHMHWLSVDGRKQCGKTLVWTQSFECVLVYVKTPRYRPS